jgi:hypothetical protein
MWLGVGQQSHSNALAHASFINYYPSNFYQISFYSIYIYILYIVMYYIYIITLLKAMHTSFVRIS